MLSLSTSVQPILYYFEKIKFLKIINNITKFIEGSLVSTMADIKRRKI